MKLLCDKCGNIFETRFIKVLFKKPKCPECGETEEIYSVVEPRRMK